MLFRFLLFFFFHAVIAVYESANYDVKITSFHGILIAYEPGTKAECNFRLPNKKVTVKWVDSDI